MNVSNYPLNFHRIISKNQTQGDFRFKVQFSGVQDTFEKSLDTIPKSYQKLFEKVENLEGKNFLRESYKGLVNILGLNSIARPKPNFSLFSLTVPAETKASADPVEGSVTIHRGMYSEPNKWEKFGNIAHELFHLKQYVDIIRHEDMTPDKYIDMLTDYCFASGFYSDKDELRELIMVRSHSFLSNALKLPKIKANSPEGERSKALFEALKNYPQITSSFSLEEYQNNLLETEAYEFQDDVFKYTQQYLASKRTM